MKRIVNKHPLAIRWFHWVNFPVLAMMIWSGLLIYWANDVYRVGWDDTTVLKFFPDSFYKAFNISGRLAEGMALHFVFMWFFAINGLLYVLYTLISGEWRYLWPERKSFKEAWLVVLHDLHLRKTAPPQIKYNAAQRIAYSAIIVMGFGSLVTGLSIYKPVQFGWLCTLCGGYEWARIEHFALTIGYTLFFVIHIVQVVLAGWKNFQAMVTGFEAEQLPELEREPSAETTNSQNS
ncbi:MAG: cytochrome b/b6 domain-containing protein [Flavipsychrobacter sp.]|nr:cytochrome b/b6 domain-containing protein [Flavipsychrobacter sp.]